VPKYFTSKGATGRVLLVWLIRHSDNPDRITLLRSKIQILTSSEDNESFLDEDEKSSLVIILSFLIIIVFYPF
jgi:hypothetical protein